MEYDLTTKPWIPVIDVHGKTLEVGLREALTASHQLHAIRDPLPTVEFGLYRLLVAFALDVFFLEPGIALDTNSLGSVYHVGRFDPDRLEAYFTEHGPKFDLFGSHPFLQTAGMEGADKPLAGLLPPVPSGTGATHFHHGPEKAFSVAPDAAARLLASISPFMTAGGAGLSPSINGAPPFYVLVTGSNLFETICRNLFAIDLRLSTGKEPPAWRSARIVGGARCKTASYAQSLTWQPRRLRLIPGDGGICSLTGRPAPILVHAMKFGPGDSCDFAWEDPNCAYRFDEKEADPAKVRKVMRPRPGREVWRDTGPLALLRHGDHGGENNRMRFQRPRVLDQLSYLGGAEGFGLTVYGMRTDLKMKVYEWQREPLDAPGGLVLRTEPNNPLQWEAQQAMDRAEKAASALRQIIKIAYPRDGKGNDSALRAVQDAAERDYWRELRETAHDAEERKDQSYSYRELLQDLAALQSTDLTRLQVAQENWKIAVTQAARKAAQPALNAYDTGHAALERQTRALLRLEISLLLNFETIKERQTREQRRKDRQKAARIAAKPPRPRPARGEPIP